MVRDYRLYNRQKDAKKKPVRMVKVKRQKLRLPAGLDKKLFILLAMTTLFISYLVIFSGNPGITIARYGRLTDDFFSKGLLAKYEEVVLAPYAGKVKLLAEDGKRFPAGEAILEIMGKEEKKIFYSAKAGILSYGVDGLESTLNPVNIQELSQDYREFRGKAFHITDGEKVNAGRPLFKIVNNFILYMVVEAPLGEYPRYKVGEKIWASFDNLTVVGWVRKKLDSQRLFVIQLERFPVEIANKRWVDVTIMTDAHTGVIIPRSALAEKDKKLGVYKLTGRSIGFIPVKENGGNLKEVVVTGIERGTEILANPAKDLVKYVKRDPIKKPAD